MFNRKSTLGFVGSMGPLPCERTISLCPFSGGCPHTHPTPWHVIRTRLTNTRTRLTGVPPPPASGWGMQMSPSESSVARLGAIQAKVINQITNTLSMVPTSSSPETTDGAQITTYTESPASGTRSRGAGYMARLSTLFWAPHGTVTDAVAWISGWMGPRVTVPHYVARMSVQGGTRLVLEIDFVPRADGGYEMRRGGVDDDGDDIDGDPEQRYEEPSSRGMFMQKSVRREMEAVYYTREMRAWRCATRVPQDPSLNVSVRKCTLPSLRCVGPCYTHVAVDVTTDRGWAFVEQQVTQATAFFVNWLQAPPGKDVMEELNQTKTMTTYAWDCKVRSGIYARDVELLTQALGGKCNAPNRIAALEAGPQDIADRSSAMTAAAVHNWKEAGTSNTYAGDDAEGTRLRN